jgi:hypothetical protein
MDTYQVIFYYKDLPAYKGQFFIISENDRTATARVYEMVRENSELIPQNWDRWTVILYKND